MTFWEFSNRYLAEVCDLHKLSTYRNEKNVITKFNDRFGGDNLSDLTPREIQIYFTSLARTCKPSTVRYYWRVMNGLLKYAESEGLVKNFRTPRLPIVRRTPQDYLTLDQMRSLIEHAIGPLKVFLMVLAETGCRIGEVLALESRHINPVDKTLTIEQAVYRGHVGTPKTDSSYRTIALTDKLCYTLDSFRVKAEPNTILFRNKNGGRLNLSTLDRHLAAVFKKVNINQVGYHAFRRGNITFLLNHLKMPLQIAAQRVGHQPGGTTLGIYCIPEAGLDAEWMSKIELVLYGKEEDEKTL